MKLARSCVVIAAALFATCSAAQQPPDAGRILREKEQERRPELPTPQAPVPAPAAPAAKPAEAAGPTLVVTAFRFEGNQRYREAQLQQVVAGYLQRPLTLGDLEVAAATVARFYREQGWLARVFLPPQEVEDGVVRFKVVEAVYGQTQFSSDTDLTSLRMDRRGIVDRVQARQSPGQKFHIPSVERGLLVADDLPGVSVAGNQVGGQQPGETDVVLKVTKEPSVFGEVGLDNHGARSTGEARIVARVGLNSPFRSGDQFDVQTQITEDLNYIRLAGSVPLGDDGLRLGANAAALNYKVGTPEFSALEPKGNSRALGLDLTYPVIRATDRNLYAGIALENKLPYNETAFGVSSDYAIRNTLLRLDGNLFDTLGGGGVSSGNLTGVFGYVDLDNSPTQAGDAATVQTQGDFQVLRYRIARTQKAGVAWTAVAAYSGQVASKNLDSAEKFYLGGPYGVRAYPVYEGAGSDGQMVNLELQRRLPSVGGMQFAVAGFYDWGRIRANVDNDFPGAPALNRYSLSGYGLRLDMQAPAQARFSATVARRIGSNPNPTSTGTDQDGSLDKTRFWLVFTKIF
jgi:hemolysin activation/secretion protein